MANGKRVKDFRPASRNANKHTARGMGELQKSIQTDGWIGAMTTAADGEMIAGSARIETVAQVFGTDAEPIIVETDGTRPVLVVRTDIPNAEDKRAQRLALADNRVHEIDMSWDVEVLAGFDADVLGELWTPEELSDLGQQWADEQRGKQEDAGAQIDKAEELRVKWGVESGQLWQLGEHRLICGDCTDKATVARVMDIQPEIMVTDPPYGVNYDPQWRSDAADAGHLAYAARRVGKVENDDRSDWRDAWALFPGDVVYSWHPPGATSLVHAAALQESGFVIRMQIIWAKSNFPIGRGDYHVRHEPCWYAVRKGKPARRTDDRTQTTLWEINLDKNVDGGHSTQKPLECMERPIRNHEFGIVYDPFLGSGTTLIACERLGRKCRAVEISPAYCAVAIER